MTNDIKALLDFCEKYGFDILTISNKSGEVDGFIIGTEEFVDKIELNLNTSQLNRLMENLEKEDK